MTPPPTAPAIAPGADGLLAAEDAAEHRAADAADHRAADSVAAGLLARHVAGIAIAIGRRILSRRACHPEPYEAGKRDR